MGGNHYLDGEPLTELEQEVSQSNLKIGMKVGTRLVYQQERILSFLKLPDATDQSQVQPKDQKLRLPTAELVDFGDALLPINPDQPKPWGFLDKLKLEVGNEPIN